MYITYDTVYKCNILNAAETRLILHEHFTMKSKHRPAAHNGIHYVSEVSKDEVCQMCCSGNCSIK